MSTATFSRVIPLATSVNRSGCCKKRRHSSMASTDTALLVEADAIAERAQTLLASIHPPSSDPATPSAVKFRLAHYTTLEALVSMLQTPSGGLRLSDSSTMNDPTEGRATREGRLIKHLLDDEFDKNSWPNRRYSDAHVCCFVGVHRGVDVDVDPGDDLLFWRLYGAECRGLSVTLAPHVSAHLLGNACVQQVIYTYDPPVRANLDSIVSLLRDLDELRSRAIDSHLWEKVFPRALPACDRLMAYRFLHKHPHYSMEREYRAIAFVTDDNAPEDQPFSARGHHVQYHRIRRYVQIPELACGKLFTTSSQITIGSNVAEIGSVEESLTELVSENLGLAPNVVSVSVSRTRYRPR